MGEGDVLLVVDLLDVEQHQICVVEHPIKQLVVVTHEAVGIQAGVDPLRLAGGKQLGDELLLQHGFPTGGGDAAAGGIHEVAVAGEILHQLGHSDLAAALGVPGVPVVAILAAHQAALHEYDEADAGAVDCAAGLDGMDPANDVGIAGVANGGGRDPLSALIGRAAGFNGRDPVND
ncbi:hypothetical protein D3C87_894020 [compost metagenome]